MALTFSKVEKPTCLIVREFYFNFGNARGAKRKSEALDKCSSRFCLQDGALDPTAGCSHPDAPGKTDPSTFCPRYQMFIGKGK